MQMSSFAHSLALIAAVSVGCGGTEVAAVPPPPAPATTQTTQTTQEEESPEVTPDAGAPEAAPPDVPAASPALHRVGDVVTAPDYTLRVEAIKECKVKYYFKAKQGNIKLGVQVLIEGNSDKDVPINPYYAKLVDSDGFAYTSTYGGCEPELKAVRIVRGEKSGGWVTFEIPEKATGLKFSYDPIIIGAAKQPITFDLGR
jgi:hypothetical protein